MITQRLILPMVAWVCLAGRTDAQTAIQESAKPQIELVLAEQARAWNRGDVDGFMEGYAKIPTLRFASGSTVTYGWQETLERYKQRYANPTAMGTLSFSELETTILSTDSAVVFGHWRLTNVKGDPHGLFTLVFRKTDAGWRIIADHTSAAE